MLKDFSHKSLNITYFIMENKKSFSNFFVFIKVSVYKDYEKCLL